MPEKRFPNMGSVLWSGPPTSELMLLWAVAFDDLYGRSTWLRDKLNEARLIYMADVPRTSQLYLEKPVLGIPTPKPGQRGPKPTRIQVLNGVKPLTVHQVARRTDTRWQRIRVRATERGELNDP